MVGFGGPASFEIELRPQGSVPELPENKLKLQEVLARFLMSSNQKMSQYQDVEQD